MFVTVMVLKKCIVNDRINELTTRRLLVKHAAAAAKSLQSSLTLCDPIDSSPSGYPVPGIL